MLLSILVLLMSYSKSEGEGGWERGREEERGRKREGGADLGVARAWAGFLTQRCTREWH